MIKIDQATLNFKTQTVFDEISLTINPSQKIGLVGANGAGKSTLLKILAGQQHFDSGRVNVSGGTTIAYLPQEITLNSVKTVLAEALTVFRDYPAWQREQELEQLLKSDPDNQTYGAEFAQIVSQLHDHDFAQSVAETKQILMGLGFTEQQFSQTVDTLSVGWRMRISLAKLLLQKASFYLFDEPTNHLDLIAKTWFLKFLEQADFGFLLVCHDRAFLEQACDQIIELANSKATIYHGNYSQYLVQKEENLERLQSAYDRQQKELAHKRAIADRFKAKASKAKMAQSILKKLDKVEVIELPNANRKIAIQLPTPPSAGRIALTVKGVGHSFGNKRIFQNVNFEIESGQKVALIAPNGTGKTTLFNLICRKLNLQTGVITPGHNVVPAIFEQDQNIALDHRKIIFDEVKYNCPNVTDQAIRTMLGGFLFSNADAYKPINVLSGGEKNRVSMVKVLLSNANLLLLDEPTNHLDIPTKEILLEALKSYKGTILFVSHDHDFVNQLATHTAFLTPDAAHLYEGSYEDYLSQQEGNLSKSKSGKLAKNVDNAAADASYDLRKQSRNLERQIERLEQDIAQLEEGYADLEYGTPEFDQQTVKVNNVKRKLAQIMQEWESLQELM